MIEIIKIILEFTKILKLLRWLHVLFVILRLVLRIYNAFHDKDIVTSLLKTNILKEAMDAVDEADISKLKGYIAEFDRLLPGRR